MYIYIKQYNHIIINIKTIILFFTLFQTFISKYNKIYSTPAEFVEKFEIFKSNQKLIKKNSPKQLTNGKLNPNIQRFGPNQFSDVTQGGFREKYLDLDVANLRAMRSSGTVRELLPDPSTEIPDSFDWRDKGVVSPVKQQGECGSCWSFATAESSKK